MSLIVINDKIAFERSEFTSVQYEKVERHCSSGPSDESMYIEFEGCVITLKNGRKVYAENVTPTQVIKLLDGKVEG